MKSLILDLRGNPAACWKRCRCVELFLPKDAVVSTRGRNPRPSRIQLDARSAVQREPSGGSGERRQRVRIEIVAGAIQIMTAV